MIQLHEQRRNHLLKASASVVIALAHVLGCSVEDLVESTALDFAAALAKQPPHGTDALADALAQVVEAPAAQIPFG